MFSSPIEPPSRESLRSRLEAMALYISGNAEPPYHALNLMPLYRGGLWLAVTITPPRTRRWRAVKEIVCEGVGLSERITRNPAARSDSATTSANSRERKRRS